MEWRVSMGEGGREVVVCGDGEGLHHEVLAEPHRLAADEPPDLGGSDRGPNPYDLLLASLGACTAMTVTMYAKRKGFPLQGVTARLRHSRIHADDCAACETEQGRIDSIRLDVELEGPLATSSARSSWRSPASAREHRTLTSEKVIEIGG
jgi:putative redox protein